MGLRNEQGPDGLRRLAASVGRLSRLLTSERDRLPEAYLQDRDLREAYFRYFLPANRAKIHIPLEELSLHPARLLAREHLRVLDIGSGPGTAVLGILDYFRGRSARPALECTAVDAVSGNLREAERLFREESPQYGPATLRTVVRTLGKPSDVEGAYDLVVLSNVLNELFLGRPDRGERRVELLTGIMNDALAPTGSCIIIEPSLRETTRDLLTVRDALAAAGYTIYSPCLSQAPCPALVHPKDWCHEERAWQPPQLIKEIDELVGLRKDALKFSYVVVRRDGHAFAECFGEGTFRVVSEPLVSKGKRELYLCGRGNRRFAMRQDKDAAPANAAFEALQRGDVVRFENLRDEDKRLRVTRDTTVAKESVGP